MGFWPFGHEDEPLEVITRVITAATQNGFRVRGKLTIHFHQPQAKAEADLAGDKCAAIAMALLREAPDHERIIGAEGILGAELAARYPVDVARARQIELLAFHVVGDPTLSEELRRASSAAPGVVGGGSRSGSSSSFPAVRGSTPSPPPVRRALPPTPSVGTLPVPPPPKRRASAQMRSLRALLLPPGTAPAAMGIFAAPVVRDSAARLLIGFLRVHDLVARCASIDEDSAEVLASLVPASDAPPGGYEASRASEIARWHAVLGPGVMFGLQHEVRVASIFLLKAALERSLVMPALASAVVEATSAAAFPEEAGIQDGLARFTATDLGAPKEVLAQAMVRITHGQEEASPVASALAPLMELVSDDLFTLALVIKASTGE